MAESMASGFRDAGSSWSTNATALQKESRRGLAMRRPKRISITIPQSVYESLVLESEVQGRSLSSLASYWLQLQASRCEPMEGRKRFPSD